MSQHPPKGTFNRNIKVRDMPSSKKAAILDAATKMFLDLGYGATSMNALVAKIGGSKATIYAHFTSKQVLFEAVTEHVLEKHITAIHSDELKNLGLKEGLMVIGQKLLELVSSDHHIRLSRLVMAETPNFPEIGRAYYDRGPLIANKDISAFLISATQGSEKKLPDPDKTASHFSAMLIHHIFLERLCGKCNVPSAKKIRAITEDTVDDLLKIYNLEQESDR
ncbi:MAG: hypothetical protein COB49_06260 [Alphaproteobacteria bacterium]|nr:MAG: hypothetical protein COB49_06260 [Alphaproteobacteria bacterium]